jgi:cell division protein ZapA
MDNKKRISVRIFGIEYLMMGNDSEEYVRGLADKVDAIMKEIAKSNNKYSATMVAVLTALNLSDVLYKTQEELSETAEKLEALQMEMQRPFEEMNSLSQELEAVKEQYSIMQSEFTRTQIEFGKVSKEWALGQEHIKDIKCELDVSKETITDLQNKLFDNQIELLKAKKELDELKGKKNGVQNNNYNRGNNKNKNS